MNSGMVKHEQSLLAAHGSAADEEDEILKENGVGDTKHEICASASDDLLNEADSESKTPLANTTAKGSADAAADNASLPQRSALNDNLPAASVGAFLEQLRKQQSETRAGPSTTASDASNLAEAIAKSDCLRKRKRAQSETDHSNADVKTAKRQNSDAHSDSQTASRLRRSSSALFGTFDRRIAVRNTGHAPPGSRKHEPGLQTHAAGPAERAETHVAAPQPTAVDTSATNHGRASEREQNGATKSNEAVRSEPRSVPVPGAGQLNANRAATVTGSVKSQSAVANANSLIAQQQLITSIIRQQQQHALLAQLGLPTIPMSNNNSLPAQMQLQQHLAQAAFQQQQAVAVLQQAAALQQQQQQQQQRLAQAQAQAAQIAAIHQLQAQAQQAAQMQAAQQAAQAQFTHFLQFQQQQAQLAALAQLGIGTQQNSIGQIGSSQGGLTGLGLLSTNHGVNGLPGQSGGYAGPNGGYSTLSGLSGQTGLQGGLGGLVQSTGSSQQNASHHLALLQQQAVAQATAQQLLAQAQQAQQQQQQQQHPNAANVNMNVGVSPAHATLGYTLVPGGNAQGATAPQLANANALMQLGLFGQAGQPTQAQAQAHAQAQAMYAAAAAQSGQSGDLGQLVLGPNGQLMRLVKPSNAAAQLRM